jgi:F0F1-type ATP synthase assembly protein I
MKFRFDYLDGLMVGCVLGALLARVVDRTVDDLTAALVLGCACAYVLVRYFEVQWRP